MNLPWTKTNPKLSSYLFRLLDSLSALSLYVFSSADQSAQMDGTK